METPTSRTTEAYDRIRQDLISGILEPGSKLAISELQVRYGLGAMPMREALNRLAAEQFVLKLEQRGFTVPALEPPKFLEIQNARIVIETAALRESVATRRRDWEERLVLSFHDLSKANRAPNFIISDNWRESHNAFHKALISGCTNPWMMTFSDHLFKQAERYRIRRRQIENSTTTLLDEHKAIMDAAIEGDADTAASRLIEHYRRSVETVLGKPVELCPDHLQFQPRDTEDNV
jgi:DNA-binding GntR family transcriptional regulator